MKNKEILTKTKDIASILYNRSLNLLFGYINNWHWPSFKARIQNLFTGKFTPFVTPTKYLVKNRQQLVAWNDLGMEKGAFDIWPNLMPESPVIYDIGANLGIFGNICRHKFPNAHIIGFEPIKEWYEYCKSLNIYDELFNVALFNSKGEASLQITEKWGTASILQYSHYFDGDVKKCNIDKLDNFNLPRPDFIKIDVDGAEIEVIKGGIEKMKCAKAILIECTIGNPNEISNLLNMKYQKTNDYLFIRNEK